MPRHGLEIRAERPKDYDAVHRLHEAAFGQPDEAELVDALRAAGDHVPELCLVAVDGDGPVVGHIFFSEARLDSGAAVLALAPMGVLPDRQRRSVGSALVRESLRRAAATAYPLVVVLGHPGYYPRFGFEPGHERGVECPYNVPPEAWMVLRLPAYRPEARGRVIYPEPFGSVQSGPEAGARRNCEYAATPVGTASEWSRSDPRMGRRLAVASLVLLAIAAAGVLIILISGDGLENPLLIAVLTGAAVAGLGAWANELASMRRRAALDEKRRGDMAARAKEHDCRGRQGGGAGELRKQLQNERAKLMSERRLRLQTEQARRAEREWARELREQVLNAYKSRGPSGDVRELVLEVAIRLSGADKGVLLSQHDGDRDGELDLVCHRGFEHDPGASSLAQRFADRVIERDEIIREDRPGDGAAPAGRRDREPRRDPGLHAR